MNNWTRVKWTEAAQVTSLLDPKADPAEGGRAPPERHFADLRKAARLDDAVFFLGLALPRYETVGWAARAVRDMGDGLPRPRADTDALKAALLWVQDPTEPRRRAAFDAAQLADESGPERLTAMAAFMSGGSLTPDDCPPVPAPKDVAGRMAAGAVLLAASRSADRKAAINQALDAGDLIAQQGLDTVAR
jgi:hypothetical protein